MIVRRPWTPWIACVVLPFLASPASAVVELPPDFVDETVGTGLVGPVNFDFLPDGRVLLVERAMARIRLVAPGTGTQAEPVGTIPDVVSAYGEQGLLGIAVDPRWPEKPYVYVHHTCASTPNIKVVRYALTGDLDRTGDGTLELDSLSRREVLADLPSDFNLHNGGTIEFGPDDLLYVAIGDDGIQCTAQDRHELRGKILRLDVRVIPDGPGPTWPYSNLVPSDNPYRHDPDPRTGLVWHRGLRNPWSFDFNPLDGRMAIADVGQSRFEEVNVVAEGGRNFGWPIFEGDAIHFSGCDVDDLSGLAMPAAAYAHPPEAGSASVILGGICHAADDIQASFPSVLWNDVFYFDLYEGRLRRIAESAGEWGPAPPFPGQPAEDAFATGLEFVTRMRFGRDGGLWYVGASTLHRIGYEGTTVGVPPDPVASADELRLTVFPSPATGAVTVEFVLPSAGEARVDVFDARGRRVRTLADGGALRGGVTRLPWDGRLDSGAPAAPGLYFVRLATERAQRTRRVVRLP